MSPIEYHLRSVEHDIAVIESFDATDYEYEVAQYRRDLLLEDLEREGLTNDR